MTVTIRQGDCREVLKTMPDQSVHMCVTSPPYFGLRDYQTASWEGGDADCDHRSPTMRDGRNEDRAKLAGSAATNSAQLLLAHRTGCGKCGAVKIDSQIGLEATPDAYVAEMVAVFRDVRRVLRDDGTLWLNLGDSYAAQRGGTNMPAETLAGGVSGKGDADAHRGRSGGPKDFEKNRHKNYMAHRNASGIGLKHKDLIGIPWRVAFALQADGWYLRQDIIWSKPNPMPESVTDRCTKAHEYIFLMSKSARYYYDLEPIREPVKPGNDGRMSASAMDGYRSIADGYTERRPQRQVQYSEIKGANRRSVWEVATQPFGEAHFATFPPDLIEPCIKAGCPERCCSKCGAPWQRQTDGATYYDGAMVGTDPQRKYGDREYGRGPKNNLGSSIAKTTGFFPSCPCAAETNGGTVLDPFGGAWTTGMVADRLKRNAILIELNPEYAAMAERRIRGDAGMFAEISA